MRTQSAPVIRLKNYAPPAFTISTVHLDVQLDGQETIVRSTLTVNRAAGTGSGVPLVLDGDELTLVSLLVNGAMAAKNSCSVSPDELVLHNPPAEETFELEIVTKLAPAANKKLMGLYQSSGVFCTQCEAEGFRRITYFLDRPDVLAIYTVKLEAKRETCEHLLANGNLVESGNLPDGRHFAIWHDPHPKPSYLFALVGGNLDSLSETFTTMSGRSVDLNIYVEKGKASMASFAMDALIRSMVWDEEVYGREYDLDVFNIVAVSDFNMGAMENKGLNVFNDKYVLADPDLASDTDYAHIEAIVAHEYFHNWTGNRITCRDWFQLCLKEGLTVYRDQEFSADQRSRPVQRIQQVRALKASQFTEDAGPLAHPVRPNAYREINNFYTATVYQKGAELVRMIAALLGPDLYRKGTDLYFDRHDGEAAVVEDFLCCFEEVSGRDLSQFARWYAQAGTPEVRVDEAWDGEKGRYELTFRQSIPPTPGQSRKLLVPIPVRFGLIGKDGKDLTPQSTSPAVHGDLIVLDRRQTKVVFTGLNEQPTSSLLRGFSAPVRLHHEESAASRTFRARHDSDLYNRWEALNGYAMDVMTEGSKAKRKGKAFSTDPRFLEVMRETAFNEDLEAEFRAHALGTPSNHDVARHIGSIVDPDAISAARKEVLKDIGNALGAEGVSALEQLQDREKSADALGAAGLRGLKNSILLNLCAGQNKNALDHADHQFSTASNMTDRLAALGALLHWHPDTAVADKALSRMYDDFRDYPLVIDKWFAMQAAIPGTAGVERVTELVAHKDFTLENPNRARSVIGTFAGANLTAFHHADGSGYAFFAKHIIAIDKINPQIAARLLTLMDSWKSLEPKRRRLAGQALQQVAGISGLSRDTQEIVDRSLK